MLKDNLKKYRIAIGYDGKEFARLVHIPYTTYMGYEKKGTWPTQENLLKIAKELGVTTDELLGYGISKEQAQLKKYEALMKNLGYGIEIDESHNTITIRRKVTTFERFDTFDELDGKQTIPKISETDKDDIEPIKMTISEFKSIVGESNRRTKRTSRLILHNYIEDSLDDFLCFGNKFDKSE
jgi:transcriptional regulator with XRE-family HTH domain